MAARALLTFSTAVFGKIVSADGLYRYVTRTNVSFFDSSPNDQRTEHSSA